MTAKDIVVGYLLNDLGEQLAKSMGVDPKEIGVGGLVLGPENLARRLWDASKDSRRPVLIPLSVLATCMAVLALPSYLHRVGFLRFAGDPDRIKEMRELWEAIAEDTPFLRGRVEPLLSWLDDATPEDDAAAAACFGIIADLNFTATIMKGMRGDILGAVANQLLWRNDKRWPRDAWRDMSECLVITGDYVDQLKEGDAWGDLMCATGTFAMALGWQLRARGRSPSELVWFLADFSEANVALTAVNLAIMGDFGDNVILCSPADMPELPKDLKTAPRAVRAPKKPA